MVFSSKPLTTSFSVVLKEPDVAGQIAQRLREIRRVLKEADVVYRQFRASMLHDPPPRHLVPPEWIPISCN